MAGRWPNPWLALGAPTAALAVFQAAYAWQGAFPSPLAVGVFSYAPSLFVFLWVLADARRRKAPCFDSGFLVLAWFPFSVLAYLLWSRGRRGLLTLAGLAGLYLVPWLCGGCAQVARALLTGVN
jgi:hypothetical protein